jgi:hypothetical protein
MDGTSVLKGWRRRVAIVAVAGLSGGGLLVLEHVGTGGAAPGAPNCHKTKTCPTTTTTIGGTTTTTIGTTTTTKAPRPCNKNGKPPGCNPSGV